jgi:hypothetical protein
LEEVKSELEEIRQELEVILGKQTTFEIGDVERKTGEERIAEANKFMASLDKLFDCVNDFSGEILKSQHG